MQMVYLNDHNTSKINLSIYKTDAETRIFAQQLVTNV